MTTTQISISPTPARIHPATTCHLTALFFAWSLYSFGAAAMNYFANYPSWFLVSADHFPAFHQFNGRRIVLFFVLPSILAFALTVMLLWRHPAVIPRQLVWALLVATAIPAVSTFTVQLPIQLRLDQVKDVPALHRLVRTNWICLVADAIQVILVLRMLWLTTRAAFHRTATQWITLSFLALIFYAFGAGVMDGSAFYPSWRLVGETEFAAYHTLIGQRIVVTFVLPLLAATALLIGLFWFRPAYIPKWFFWALLTGNLIGWISSALIQIPIQAQLSQAKNDALLDTLMLTDWIRVIPFFLNTLIAYWMLTLLIEKSEQPLNSFNP